jgi:AcrR family transcriptional regulator
VADPRGAAAPHSPAHPPRARAVAEGAGSRDHPQDGRHRSTRERIQAVALELFAAQGYDKTSLREIAERLGVTKAALYYHFQSKEDIVASLVADYFGQIDALIEWGRGQPRNPGTRAEVLRRYFTIVAGGSQVFRMLQQNQAAIGSMAAARHRSELFRERMDAMVELLTEPGATLAAQLRAAVALASVSFGCMFYADRAASPAELRAVVLTLASDLAGAQPAAS